MNIRTKIAAVTLAVAALVAAPAAAFASTYPVQPGAAVSGDPAPGGTVAITAGPFDAGSSASFTVTGENGAGITQAFLKLAVSTSPTFTSTVGGSGSASVSIALPSNASGTYTTTATGVLNGNPVSYTTTFAIGGGSLPATGVDAASMAGIWIGGGVLLLGGLVVTVVAARRKSAAEAR